MTEPNINVLLSKSTMMIGIVNVTIKSVTARLRIQILLLERNFFFQISMEQIKMLPPKDNINIDT